MKKRSTSRLLRITALTVVLVVVFSLLCSCGFLDNVLDQENLSKDEIVQNVASLEQKNYKYVCDYIVDSGIRKFDDAKFRWVENVFHQNFNLDIGLPSTYDHAKMTLDSFIKLYHDNVDMANESDVTDALITCYIDAIGDPFSVYRTPVEDESYSDEMSGKFGGIGVVIQYDHAACTLMVSSIYIDSPADEAGMMVGDYIVAVDGKSVDEIGYLDVVYHVRGEIGTTVNITLKRGDTLVDVVATRAEVEEKTVVHEVIENNIGYIQISSFKDNTYKQFAESINELEKIGVSGYIFDLRNNLGGYVNSVASIISYLIPNNYPIISYQYKGEPQQVAYSTTDKNPTTGLSEDHKTSLPIVVICNEYTASSGEIFTAAMRDYTDMGLLNATIVGTTTYGKGIMQGQRIYFDGSSVTLTISYYNPPCGKNYHKIGITPDIQVENDIVDNKLIDKQFPAAIKILKERINAN